jgi:hydroxyethylthiazole kinase
MDVYSYLKEVREKKPLVHHLTNLVTIYDCAQVVKSFGASPVMAHAQEEAAEMAGIASALVLNIGTLTCDLIESMKTAARAANKKGIPVVLDVCGAGATAFRDRKSFELLDETGIAVIKGNASEIARIAGRDVRTRGVDSAEVGENLRGIAAFVAKQRSCTVVVTGKEDLVAGPDGIYTVNNGHELMAHVVGTGCMATSVIGTFAGAAPDRVTAAAAAGLSCYEIAGELAAAACGGPGTFNKHLFDRIFHLTADEVATRQKVSA